MNWTDYLLIALMAFSCIAGFVRGFVREVLALVTWVAAVWISWHYAGQLEPHLGGVLAEAAVRPWVARVLIFMAVVLVGTFIGLIVTRFMRLSLFSGLDRFLGGIFGLLRGIVMVGVFVMLCHGLRLQGEPWWRGSLLLPYAEHAANVLRAMVGERKIYGERTI